MVRKPGRLKCWLVQLRIKVLCYLRHDWVEAGLTVEDQYYKIGRVCKRCGISEMYREYEVTEFEGDQLETNEEGL